MSEAGRKKKGLEFTAEVCFDAAREHMAGLEKLYFEQQYTWAIYAAGVAVESIFRAYKCRISSEFDSRHDLYELAKDARFAAVIPDSRVETYSAALGNVASRWANNHRYRSETALRAFLKRAKLDRGIRGDFLKENARRIISAATDLVSLGILKWEN